MKNMIVGKKICIQKAQKHKEQIIIKVNELRQEMVKAKSKFDDLVEKNKDLDLAYVNNRLEEYDELV